MTSDEMMLESALKIASTGIKIFVVEGIKNGYCTCGKKIEECTQKSGKVQAGKHPILPWGSWTKLSTNEPNKIVGWFKNRPGINIAFHAGTNNAIITDFDGPEGCAEFEKIFSEHPDWFNTPIDKSGAGYHVYHTQPPKNITAFNTLYGEVRIGDQYAVIAPSNHNTGREYATIPGHALWEIQLQILPVEFHAYLKSIAKVKEQSNIKPLSLNTNNKDAAFKILDKYNEIPAWVKEEIRIGNATEIDRSKQLYKECCALYKAKIPTDEILLLLKYSPYNKFAKRHDEEKRLVNTIQAVIDKNGEMEKLEEQIKLPTIVRDSKIVDWILKNYHSNIIYVTGRNGKGEYYIYDCGKHVPDGEMNYQKFIEKAARELMEEYIEAAELVEPKYEVKIMPNGEEKKTWTPEYKQAMQKIKDIEKYLDFRNMTGLWNILKGRLAKSIVRFDTDYNYLNFKNKTYLIKPDVSGEHIIEQSPEHMITKQMPAKFDKDAVCPMFTDELKRSFKTPQEQRWIRALFGGSLARKTRKMYVFFYGPADTGKTTILNIILMVLGNDGTGYGAPLASDTFTSSKAKQTTRNDLLMTKHACLIGIDEYKHDEKQDTSAIKAWTGGGKRNLRGLYAPDEMIDNSATVINTCNELPNLDSTDPGMVTRTIVIPFTDIIPKTARKDEFDKYIFEKESSGILNWLLEGMHDYLSNGMPELPERFKEATDDYVRDNNKVEKYIAYKCVVDVKDKTGARMTWPAFMSGLTNYYKTVELVDEKYIPGQKKILSILHKKGITFKTDPTRIDDKIYRNVLVGIRYKTEIEDYEEELKAWKEDSEIIKREYPPRIIQVIEKSMHKCMTVKEITSNFKGIPDHVIERICDYMVKNGSLIKDGPIDYALPYDNEKLRV